MRGGDVLTEGVHVFDRVDELGEFAAAPIVDAVEAHEEAAIGLATGSSPLVAYEAWARLSRARGVDNSQVWGFALDEYAGLDPEHPESYRSVIAKTVTSPVGLSPERVRVLDGAAENGAECADFERALAAAGGIDVQLLGVGRNGHLAFNEPGSAFDSRTRRVALTPETIADNARFFESVTEVPTHAVTQGIGTILGAKHIVVIAIGEAKAQAVADSIDGPLTESVPGSALRMHPSVVWCLDRAAASLLRAR